MTLALGLACFVFIYFRVGERERERGGIQKESESFFLRPRKVEEMETKNSKKKKGTHREPHGRGVSRVEPDLADGFDGRHAREGDLHLAEEEGGARVALGDVLRREEFLLFSRV